MITLVCVFDWNASVAHYFRENGSKIQQAYAGVIEVTIWVLTLDDGLAFMLTCFLQIGGKLNLCFSKCCSSESCVWSRQQFRLRLSYGNGSAKLFVEDVPKIRNFIPGTNEQCCQICLGSIDQKGKNKPNGHKIYQMAVESTKNLYPKVFQSIPEFGFLVSAWYISCNTAKTGT
jgi:hypothetical protein